MRNPTFIAHLATLLLVLIVWPAVATGQTRLHVRADGTLDPSGNSLYVRPGQKTNIKFIRTPGEMQLFLNSLKARAEAARKELDSSYMKAAFDLDERSSVTAATEQLASAAKLDTFLSGSDGDYYKLRSIKARLDSIVALQATYGQVGYGAATAGGRGLKRFSGNSFEFGSRHGVGNEVKLTFLTNDLVREFDRLYYNALLVADSTVASYDRKETEKDFAGLDSLRVTYDSLSSYVSEYSADNFDWYCGDRFAELYELVENRYDSISTTNRFFSDQLKDWVLRTLWLSDGTPQLNPFGFTDEDKLPLKPEPGGFDHRRASEYDNYIEAQIALRRKHPNPDIEQGVKELNKLLKLRGTGSELYKNRSVPNAALRTVNNNNRTAALTTRVWHEVNLRQTSRSARTSQLNIDASGGIHFTDRAASGVLALPNSRAIYAMAVNVPNAHKIMVSPKSEEIQDQSAAVASLSNAAGSVGVAFTGAGRLGSFAATINTLARSKTRIAGVIPLNYTGLAESENKEFGIIEGEADAPIYRQEVVDLLQAITVEEISSRCGNRNLSELLTDLLHQEVDRITEGILDVSRERTFDALRSQSVREGLISQIVERLNQRTNELIQAYNNQRKKVSSLTALFSAPSTRILPPDYLPQSATLTDTLVSQTYPLPTPDKAARHTVLITEVNQKAKPLDSLFLIYKTAAAHRFSASVGLSYQIDHRFERITATAGDAGISTEVDNDRLRTTVGLHVHLAPMLNVNNSFFNPISMPLSDWLSRLSIMAGVSFPDPLENYHLGAAIDLLPGLKLIGGQHFFRRVDYTVVNGTITEEDPKIAAAGPYLGITLDPTVVTRFFGITN